MPIVVGGAVCAAFGRLVLAHGNRRFRDPLSVERLDVAAETLTGDRR